MNAIKPAPISAATVYAGWFGTDAILEALNYLIAGSDETTHRRTGPWGCWTFAWLQGPNQYGEPWFWNVFTGGAGGAGALPFRDGESAMMGIQTVDAFAPNVEEYELMSPVLFLKTGLAPDTGGVGRYRGGLAPETLCAPYDTESWDVTVFQNRMSAPASAVSGGYPGAGSAISFARNVMDDVRDKLRHHERLSVGEYALHAERPPARARGFTLSSRDAYYIRATGGPGYGDPLEREPEAVLADVERGYVSPQMARDAYHVALDSSAGGVDLAATEQLRAHERQWRLSSPSGADVLPVGDGSGGCPEHAAAIPVTTSQLLGEYLVIDEDGWYGCRRCGHRLSTNATNWKWWAQCAEAQVEPTVIHNAVVVRRAGDIVFRRYFCPGCAVQLDTEVTVNGEAPRWNFRPLGVEPPVIDPSGEP